MAYATITDYEVRHGTVPSDQQQTVETLLGDAAVMLDGMVTVNDCDAHQAEALKIVSCSMVRRAVQSAEASAFGVQQATASVGPFSQSYQFANPSGGMYVSAAERALLGADDSYIGTLPARVEGWYGTNA